MQHFAKTSKIWSQNDEALSGWMPEGKYCPNGCVTVYAEYPDFGTERLGANHENH